MKPIDLLTGGWHSEQVKRGACTTCGGLAIKFRDDLSRREHKISGMCQKCQDEVFEEEAPDAAH